VYELDDRGSRVLFLAGARNFYLHHRVQNGSGAHPASYPMGTRGSFPGVKLPGREADHSPPSSAEIKNARSYASTPQYFFTAWCLVKHRDNFTLPFYLCPSGVRFATVFGHADDGITISSSSWGTGLYPSFSVFLIPYDWLGRCSIQGEMHVECLI
jgi:hypothetical protein